MIQQTMAEELHFIHEHIEQIELRVDAINEELAAMHTVLRALLVAFERLSAFEGLLTAIIERADGAA